MNQTAISEELHVSLLKFLLRGKRTVISSGAALGLSSMQAMTLLLADSTVDRSMNYYRKMYQCDASNITGIIDGLEDKGLVSRHEHAKDRRIKMIHLEPAGKAIRSKLMKSVMDSDDRSFAVLSETERELLLVAVDKLVGQDTTDE
jgi:DNA-binding MarR family transcriptional regulator